MSTEFERSVRPSPAAEPSRIGQLEDEVRHLTAALTSRAEIDQAKGVLMLHLSVDSETAFRVLVRWSSHTNTKLAVLARELAIAATEGHTAVARIVLEIPHRGRASQNGAQSAGRERLETTDTREPREGQRLPGAVRFGQVIDPDR